MSAVAPAGDRAAFAARVVAAWRQALDGVVEAGKALVEAKAALEHGQFQAMVESDLPFGTSTARMLMKIAQDGRLLKREHAHVLPASWMTLYELTKLDDDSFENAMKSGAIRPDMERKDALALRTADRRVVRLARAESLATAAPPLTSVVAHSRRYPIIYADPPWTFETLSDAGKQKSPENHYPTMSIEDLKALPVGDVAGSTAALFLWTTVPHLDVAIELMRHWGFHYRSHLIWRKTNADGRPHRGTGFWFINTHELLLLGTRGNSSAGMPAPLMGTQAESVIEAAVGRHSEKPAIFHELIERYFPDVGRLELFARARRPGWDSWGNEVDA